jgi:DNA-binding Lrp family transcriptional regulator
MRELRQQYRLPYRAIAEKFDCSLWTVRDIVNYWTRPV